jgi:sporulation protein YlmC with PRC-barrel domain
MKYSLLAAAVFLILLTIADRISAQVAGSTTVGVEVTELNAVAMGWSARRQILGRIVYNEKGEKVGRVDDLIITPDKALSFAIIGAGGFVGLGTHDVAIPVNQFQERDGKLVLDGATKEVIKALPRFDYSTSK